MMNVETAAPSLSRLDYRPTPGIYDEMCSVPGVIRPHWAPFLSSLTDLGTDEVARRWQTALHRIRENGVTYNVYGDPLGMDRPWNLDAIPLLIPPAEWAALETGLIQRAKLLNLILADVYGPQALLRDGSLPPALVYANPGFWRPLHHIPVPNNTFLHLIAVDLARSADGQWWVLSDRTQAPSGAGYALENRIVLAETFPDLFREFQVKRLASFFRAFRENLINLAPSRTNNPRIVLLTPGPLNETYFEHSYLARYLGFPLVQGADLTVRNGHVFLKTLEGLNPVDVILRRVDAGYCDPIELRSDSYLGVAGLVEAVRAGNVVIANALGSGVVETAGMMPFLPGLSERILGEKLRLPSIATWWCGQPAPLNYVKDNLKFLVIRSAFRSSRDPVFGGQLKPDERANLLERIEARPYDYAAQESLNLSTAPVWSENGLTARRIVLRVYLAAVGDSWIVMPGGLTRVSPSIENRVVSMQRGGGSKDTWVLSDVPVDNFTLRRPRDLPVQINRGATDLPSRVADYLFWVGRYAERSENLARVLRCILVRLTAEAGPSGSPEWESLLHLHASLESAHSRLAAQDPQGHLDALADFEHEILSLIFEEERTDSLHSNLNRITWAAAQVRDRFSADLLRVISQIKGLARADSDHAWGYVSTGDALSLLNRTIATLSALRGIELENITRGTGWHFLSMGRRIERSIQLINLFRVIVVPFSPNTWPMLEMLLDIADSSMTYRSRYFTALQPAPVLDLLLNDELNPRSLAFQIKDLSEHCRSLSSGALGDKWPLVRQHRIEEAAASLFRSDVNVLCHPEEGGIRFLLDKLLDAANSSLLAFSDDITHIYFSHAILERST